MAGSMLRMERPRFDPARHGGRPTVLPATLAVCATLAVPGLLGGCATVLDGTTQTIALDTAPRGASCLFQRDGVVLGRVRTPGSLTVRRSPHDIVLTCERPGSQVVRLTLASIFTGTTVGNVVGGLGPFGAIVDASSGADFRYPETLLFAMPAASPALPVVAGFDNPYTRPPFISDRPGPATGNP